MPSDTGASCNALLCCPGLLLSDKQIKRIALMLDLTQVLKLGGSTASAPKVGQNPSVMPMEARGTLCAF